MTKLTEILNNILNEELLGTIKGYEVYKNPKSIKRMDGKMRAISDKNGDLYVVDDYGEHVTHLKIVKWLSINGFVNIGVKIIRWQRLKNSNLFYLGSGYTKTSKDFLEKLMKKVKSKNSQYNFILKNITDVE